jgi:hypothetical protein
MNRNLHRAGTSLLLALVAGASLAAPTDTASTIEALKATYLDCDRVSSQRRLDMTEAVACSTASEQLLREGFGGDFDRLLAWWRSAKLAAAAPNTELARR